ncbi:hypothetical protein O0880_06570 [Janthinobacterium sp. SUN118]|uniref:hypothetical protein n=1 Tax=Janthinobacterium sp. SUN118 TaxID=3004100 RepID=UPI0025B10418|nr:hypothetical protein [Janthinobacterium sp. SUN118]MDN2709087.1 hypothetical protein [Janthinobacterium sp. SUN118]
MNSVFYLCRSPDDPEQFVFADELPNDYYSPGLFVVEASTQAGVVDQIFKFRARQGEQVLELELKRSENGRAYIVNAAKNGTFYFKLVAFKKSSRYVGLRSRVFQDMPLYRIEPANMGQLERACINRDFYFIGSSGIQTGNDI